MKTGNRDDLTNLPEAAAHKALSSCASIEELIEEVWQDCKKAKRFPWVLKLRLDVLWEAIAAVGCASGGILTMGHPNMSLLVAGVVPLAIQMLKLAAAAYLGHRLYKLFHRLFH
jgi:hypothetical protein